MRALVSNLKVFLYFCQTSFNAVYSMLSLIIAGKLSRCILTNCTFINRRLAPTVSTICTTAQLTNNQISLLWDRDQQYGWQHYFQFWPAFWFKHFIEWGLSLISSCFWFWYTFPEIQGGCRGDTQQYRGATTCLKTQILKNVRRRSFQTEDLTISTNEG